MISRLNDVTRNAALPELGVSLGELRKFVLACDELCMPDETAVDIKLTWRLKLRQLHSRWVS